MKRRDDSLIGQVVAANVVLVALALLAASLAAGLNLTISDQRWEFLVLSLAIVLTLCVNLWMLQRRFAPLEHLIERVESIDPAVSAGFEPTGDPVEEIDRMERSFKRLLDGIEAERRKGSARPARPRGGAPPPGARPARRGEPVPHGDPPAARGAHPGRSRAPRRARGAEAARQPGDGGAAEPCPPAAAGRARRPRTGAGHRGPARGLRRPDPNGGALEARGTPDSLDDDRQTAIYRVAQEALANVGRHSSARSVEVELAALESGGAELQVRDDGSGFDPARRRNGGLGLEGMAERARLVGGELDVRSAPGAGTQVTLRIPA